MPTRMVDLTGDIPAGSGRPTTIGQYASPYTPFGPAPTETETLEETWNPVQDLVSPALIRRLAVGLGGLMLSGIHFADVPAARVGLAALRSLPQRLQQFLLKHPESIEVGSSSLTEMWELSKRLGLSVEKTPTGAFIPRAGSQDNPHLIRLLAAFSDEGTAGHEFLHAADFLKSGLRPSVGTAIPAREVRPVREVLKQAGYANMDLPSETFASMAWSASRDPLRRGTIFETLQNPSAREQFLNSLESIAPNPVGP